MNNKQLFEKILIGKITQGLEQNLLFVGVYRKTVLVANNDTGLIGQGYITQVKQIDQAIGVDPEKTAHLFFEHIKL